MLLLASIMPNTTVVNIKNKRCDVRIDRTTMFGNPYRIGSDGDRKQVIEKYRIYFYNKLKNSKFRDKVLQLKGKSLGCHCNPLACHGDVIVEYLEGINEIKHDTKTIDFTDFE